MGGILQDHTPFLQLAAYPICLGPISPLTGFFPPFDHPLQLFVKGIGLPQFENLKQIVHLPVK